MILKYIIISRNNLRNFYVKQNKHFIDLQYTFLHNNKYNENVRNEKILDNMKKLDCDMI